jgi:hypothetical protein
MNQHLPMTDSPGIAADALCASCTPAPLASPWPRHLPAEEAPPLVPDQAPVSVLPAALAYAKRGWTVFPVPRGTKKSHKSAKYSDGRNWGATRDPNQIRIDFARWPNANIGLPSGAESGFFVIEGDTIEGHGIDGIASLRALEAEHGKLPDTYTVESPSGSPHYYFKHPGKGIKIKCSTSELAAGVDCKGDGGMVLAPPSVKPGVGAYTVIRNVELADPPAWLLERVIEKERPSPEPRASEGNGTANDTEIMAALAVIDPDINRSAWFAIGCVLLKELGEAAGFEVWNEWSKKGKKYPGLIEIAKQWQSIVAKDGYGWSVATIFHYANEADPWWSERYCQKMEAELDEASSPENVAKLKAEMAGLAALQESRIPAFETLSKTNSGSIVAEQDEARPKDDEPRAEAEQPKTNGSGAAADSKSKHASRIVMVRASNIVMRPKSWIWEGHLARENLEMLTGLPGLGKSQVHCHLVACATTGSKWPDGAAGIEPVNVIMVTAEDALDSEVVPRLVAAGANRERVFILKCIRTDKQQRQFLLAEDLAELERVMAIIGNVGLITIDPITAYMGGKMDSHKATEVRSQLGPLKDFSELNKVAVSAITHPPKNASQRAIDHFIGSQAFIAAARIGHVCIEEVVEEEDEEGNMVKEPTGRTLFTNPKNNAHKTMPTLAYEIGEIVVGQDQQTGETIAAPRVIWGQEVVNINADQALAAAKPRKARDETQAKVQAFLREMLVEAVSRGNPRIEEKHIREQGEQRGFTIKQLRTAKEKLGIKSEKTGFDGGWVWYQAL